MFQFLVLNSWHYFERYENFKGWDLARGSRSLESGLKASYIAALTVSQDVPCLLITFPHYFDNLPHSGSRNMKPGDHRLSLLQP